LQGRGSDLLLCRGRFELMQRLNGTTYDDPR
jgi:hypothetical protein